MTVRHGLGRMERCDLACGGGRHRDVCGCGDVGRCPRRGWLDGLPLLRGTWASGRWSRRRHAESFRQRASETSDGFRERPKRTRRRVTTGIVHPRSTCFARRPSWLCSSSRNSAPVWRRSNSSVTGGSGGATEVCPTQREPAPGHGVSAHQVRPLSIRREQVEVGLVAVRQRGGRH